MRFVHLRHQAFGEEPVQIDQCIKAIGDAIRTVADAWYWLDNAEKSLEVLDNYLKEYHEAPDKRSVAPKLRSEYSSTRNYLEYLKTGLQNLAKALEEVARKCGYRAKLVEDAVKELEFRANDIDRLLKLLDEAYEKKDPSKLSSVEWTLKHDVPYTIRDKTSKLAFIVSGIASKLRRGIRISA